MKEYTTKVIKNQEICDGTILTTVARPEGFTFKAGQFVKLVLPQVKDSDPKESWRYFSIASAPVEKNLIFAARCGSSKFKQALEKLRTGDSVSISEACGKLHLPTDAKKHVFLIGGVGITPIRSLLIEANAKIKDVNAVLFYSNYRPEDTVFLEDLNGLDNINLKIVTTMTNMEKSKEKWDGETGFINIAMIKKYISDIFEPSYYIVGSPGFCDAMVEMLNNAKIKRENIILETFTGL